MPPLPLPPDLAKRYQELARSGFDLLQRHRFLEAEQRFDDLYKLILGAQPTGGRYHKGLPLQNRGAARLFAGDVKQALRSFVLAYTEDLLSLSSEDEANATPAGQTLIGTYDLRLEFLQRLRALAAESKAANQEPGDPEVILRKALQPSAEASVDEALGELVGTWPEVPKRRLEDLNSPWEERVFVGGSYDQPATLNGIKKAVQRAGHDAILALEFEMPAALIHHHTLLLLHSCKFAIFDLFPEAGQMMEIERLRDYGIKPLLVYQAWAPDQELRGSAMLVTLLKQLGYKVRPYSETGELGKLVDEYLTTRSE